MKVRELDTRCVRQNLEDLSNSKSVQRVLCMLCCYVDQSWTSCFGQTVQSGDVHQARVAGLLSATQAQVRAVVRVA